MGIRWGLGYGRMQNAFRQQKNALVQICDSEPKFSPDETRTGLISPANLWFACSVPDNEGWRRTLFKHHSSTAVFSCPLAPRGYVPHWIGKSLAAKNLSVIVPPWSFGQPLLALPWE
jgi:hypothetical protein